MPSNSRRGERPGFGLDIFFGSGPSAPGACHYLRFKPTATTTPNSAPKWWTFKPTLVTGECQRPEVTPQATNSSSESFRLSYGLCSSVISRAIYCRIAEFGRCWVADLDGDTRHSAICKSGFQAMFRQRKCCFGMLVWLFTVHPSLLCKSRFRIRTQLSSIMIEGLLLTLVSSQTFVPFPLMLSWTCRKDWKGSYSR